MIGTNLNLDLPSDSDTLAVFAAKTVVCLSSIQDTVEAKATPGAIDITSSLSFGGNQATEVGAVILAEASTPITAGAFYYNDGFFYIRDAVGAIKLSNNGTLNAASIGGIGGDYGGVNPASVTFDTASQEYRFKANASTWADLVADDVVLMEASGTDYVRLTAPALTASYTITFPSAVPGATSVVQMANTGAVTVSNTVPTLTAPDYRYTSAQTLVVNPSDYRDHLAAHTAASLPGWWALGNSTGALIVSLPVRAGDRITGFTVYAGKSSDATNTLTARLESHDSAGAQTNISSATNAANAPGAITLAQTGLTEDVTATKSYVVRIFQSDSTPSAPDQFYMTAITVTRP